MPEVPPLVPPLDETALSDMIRLVGDWIAEYREHIVEYPVLARVEPGEIAARLPARAPESGQSMDRILADVDAVLMPGITHWNHPGFFAYFSSSASPPGLLAEMVIAALGVNAMSWETSPAGTELEERMIEWLAGLLGLPSGFRGVILDTASTSSFTAAVAAREALDLGIREKGLVGRPELPLLTSYVSEHAHFSVGKAIVAAGLGLDNVRRIPVDGQFRMRAIELRSRLESDRAAGALPMMVCATIGTTSSTSVDPVAKIADMCEEFGVWLHVDAAYAGVAALLPEMRNQFSGWERADSIVVNPHKWLFTPLDCSVLLFRRPELVRGSLALTAEYLRGREGATNLMDYGLSLGRRFRALKLWFVIRYYGAEGLRSILRDHIAWAGSFAKWVAADPRFEVAAPVPFSTVCFRALPPRQSDADDWNRRLLEAVNRRGEVFMSHTDLDGRYTLRMSVGSVNSTAAYVRRAFESLGDEHDRLTEETG